MCFMIDKKARVPKQKTAYKVVRLDRTTGMLRSAVYPFTMKGDDWNYPGAVVKCSRGPSTNERGNHAAHGIYVYLSRKHAEAESSWRIHVPFVSHAILEVLVDPEDYLHSSILTHYDFAAPARGRMATYRKVTVKERQKYIDWYD